MCDKYYTMSDYAQDSFYQMPKWIYEEEKYKCLSNNARCLYMMLKSRFNISVKNEWFDEKKRIYFVFKQQELAKLLCISIKTVQRCLEDLKSKGLVEARTGRNNINQYYLLKPGFDDTPGGDSDGNESFYDDSDEIPGGASDDNESYAEAFRDYGDKDSVGDENGSDKKSLQGSAVEKIPETVNAGDTLPDNTENQTEAYSKEDYFFSRCDKKSCLSGQKVASVASKSRISYINKLINILTLQLKNKINNININLNLNIYNTADRINEIRGSPERISL